MSLEKEIDEILNSYSDIQLEGYKESSIPDIVKLLKKQGHLKGELAVIGILMYQMFKEDAKTLNKSISNLENLVNEAGDLLKKLNKYDSR